MYVYGLMQAERGWMHAQGEERGGAVLSLVQRHETTLGKGACII